MPTRGNFVLPDTPTNPEALEVIERLMISRGCPRRDSYSPRELQEVSAKLGIDGSVRSWQRLCHDGEIFALQSPGGRGYKVPREVLIRHLAARQNVIALD